MSRNNNQAKYLVEAKGPDIVDLTPKDLMEKRKNKYLMVNCIARRARDLNRGERALVELPPPHTNTELVVAEIRAGKMAMIRKQKSKVLVNLIKND
jgi:DNA-directed RNA polymerase omega subunit